MTNRPTHAHRVAGAPSTPALSSATEGAAIGGTELVAAPGIDVRAREPRRLPWGVALFLGYAFVILAIVALSLPTVIDLAIDTPVSFVGLVVMALLAYTIFTITLFLQRKAAARALGLGLASLTVPLIAIALVSGLAIPAIFVAALAGLLFRGLTRPATGRWLDEV